MNAYRYIWDVVRTEIVDATGDQVSCPHRSWRYDEAPPYCHDCMEPGLARLVGEGARDDEILPAFVTIPVPERCWIEATLDRVRGAGSGDRDGPTEYAREKIAEINRLYPDMRRAAGPPGLDVSVASI